MKKLRKGQALEELSEDLSVQGRTDLKHSYQRQQGRKIK